MGRGFSEIGEYMVSTNWIVTPAWHKSYRKWPLAACFSL